MVGCVDALRFVLGKLGLVSVTWPQSKLPNVIGCSAGGAVSCKCVHGSGERLVGAATRRACENTKRRVIVILQFGAWPSRT